MTSNAKSPSIKYLLYFILMIIGFLGVKAILVSEDKNKEPLSDNYKEHIGDDINATTKSGGKERSIVPTTTQIIGNDNDSNTLKPSEPLNLAQDRSGQGGASLPPERSKPTPNHEVFYSSDEDRISVEELQELQERSVEYTADLLISLGDETNYTPEVEAQLAEWNEKFGSNIEYQNEVEEDLRRTFGNTIDYSLPKDKEKQNQIFREVEAQLAPYQN